eukprot:Awhi_evm1s2714
MWTPFIDNQNTDLDKYMFMTSPSAHKIEDLRTAHFDIYKSYMILAFEYKPMDEHLRLVL